MLSTLNKMDGSRALSKLEDKLQKMKKRLAKEIDSKHRQMEQRRNLPKAVIPIFDTDHPESFLDFEYNMTNILVYDNEHLNISTLTSAIIGSQRQKVLNSIRHKTSIEDIWSILRRKSACPTLGPSTIRSPCRTSTGAVWKTPARPRSTPPRFSAARRKTSAAARD